MFDRKAYMKEYQKKNKEEIKEYNKNRYQNNKEKIKKQRKEHYQNNKKKTIKQQKKWNKNNPKRRKKTQQKYSKENPIKIKARNYAKQHKQRQEFCLLCLLEGKKTKAKAFHHTDYEANLGFSVCQEHHKIVDNWRKI